MRPQVGKRANMYTAPKEKKKTKARLFVEHKMRHSIAMKDDYLTIRDVAIAINMNALEQRILTRQKVLEMMSKKLTREKLIEKIEEENELDQHRLSKYNRLLEG